MKSIKVILSGIVLILSSLFFINIYFIPEVITLGLFIFGIIVCVIGLFFIHDYETDEDECSGEDEEDYEENI